MIISNLIMLD